MRLLEWFAETRGIRQPFKEWFLLRAPRYRVAAIILLVVFLSLILISVIEPLPLSQAISNRDPVETLFFGLLSATITSVTLVVTINQLVLSQEIGDIGEKRRRLQNALDFKTDVEDSLDTPVSPSEPSPFLQLILDETVERAESLSDSVESVEEAEVTSQVDRYVYGLSSSAEDVSTDLGRYDFGTFQVIFSLLKFDYPLRIHQARQIRDTYRESLPTEAIESLDDVIEVLRFFAPAREHVKALYFQWELINLSRVMLYTSVPALVTSISMILFVHEATLAGSILGVENFVWLVSAATIVALVPFTILFAYILRVATVAKRTLPIGPFVLSLEYD